MSFFRFTGEQAFDFPQPPSRLYASLDRIEPDFRAPGEPFVATYEAVDADWFDAVGSRHVPGGFDVKAWETNISVVEIDSRFHPAPEVAKLPLIPRDRPHWIEIVFDDSVGRPIDHFLNLFQIAPLRRTGLILPVHPSKSAELEDTLSIDDLPDASRSDIENAIAGTGDAAAVYDVGQGNCNAILDVQHRPTLYFDFGGGVMRNTPTYPPGQRHFCFSQSPALVLSHWDWDHWSSALRSPAASIYPAAAAATWIVPRQWLGAVHRTLLAGLASALIWPSGLTRISKGSVAVHKCNGPGRNHSGLVMVFEPSWAVGNGVLLTGDCDYSYLPPAIDIRRNYDVIVVPHHGGRMRKAATPPPVAASYQRLCLSYGKGNTFRHPFAATITNHATAGWTTTSQRDTPNRTVFLPWTAGHILLDNGASPVVPPCGPVCATCTAACDLPAMQT
jgi:hypothetical protein